mmetsp:Transcript_43722/g.123866  ORF Transcript_43722/g.123866 Transcript_43722/m.123866 type:complete len:216 (+) Transcript_43722:792-1439(+)
MARWRLDHGGREAREDLRDCIRWAALLDECPFGLAEGLINPPPAASVPLVHQRCLAVSLLQITAVGRPLQGRLMHLLPADELVNHIIQVGLQVVPRDARRHVTVCRLFFDAGDLRLIKRYIIGRLAGLQSSRHFSRVLVAKYIGEVGSPDAPQFGGAAVVGFGQMDDHLALSTAARPYSALPQALHQEGMAPQKLMEVAGDVCEFEGLDDVLHGG